MSENVREIILSGNHLDLTDALKSSVNEKLDKLFRHEDSIIRIRVELEYSANRKREREYTAKGIIEVRGPDMVVSVSSDDLYKSIDLLATKLDRKLRRRSRLTKVKRKHTHEVEIPAVIPKATAA